MLLHLMTLLLTSSTDEVFLAPLFLSLSVAFFPLPSTPLPKEKREEGFTAALKCSCPAQGRHSQASKTCLHKGCLLCCDTAARFCGWEGCAGLQLQDTKRVKEAILHRIKMWQGLGSVWFSYCIHKCVSEAAFEHNSISCKCWATF